MMGMNQELAIDRLLTACLRGETVEWPNDFAVAAGIERILYHGVAGLLTEQSDSMARWPSDLAARIREQAVAQAMWEMRHKLVLAPLLGALAEAGITTLLLKGSALAYDLYTEPAARSRGDSDILVAPSDLAAARRLLASLGFALDTGDGSSDGHSLQEIWNKRDGGLSHQIDLHWQLLNAPALVGVMDFATCAAEPLALPGLGPGAQAMSRVSTLLHTAVHRAMHLTSPYFVDGVTYYGGDRLIWASDIDRLATALFEREWDLLRRQAIDQGIAGACLDGLAMARRLLGTVIPPSVTAALGSAGSEPASDYLLGTAASRRAWSDFKAIRGWRRKVDYAVARVLPSASFMRAKYPAHSDRPLAMLYAKRTIDLFRRRATPGDAR